MPKMYGPAMDGSGTVVNRDVPDADVQAYVAAGYQMGSKPDAPSAEEYGKSQQKAQDAAAKAEAKQDAADAKQEAADAKKAAKK